MLFKETTLVKGKQFHPDRRIGPVMQAVKVFNRRNVDELFFLDVGATPNGTEPDLELVEEMASECFMPLTVGGGIRTLDHIRDLLSHGADKVCIGSSFRLNPKFINDASKKFGAQCITVSVETMNDTLEEATRCSVVCKIAEDMGAGEILLQSVSRDGMMGGMDRMTIQFVSEAVSVPVVASCGAGKEYHFAEALNAGADAVAAGSIFHFTDITPRDVAAFLHDKGYAVRYEPPKAIHSR